MLYVMSGWLNIYPSGPMAPPENAENAMALIYKTRKLADRHALPTRVACVQINWHEHAEEAVRSRSGRGKS